MSGHYQKSDWMKAIDIAVLSAYVSALEAEAKPVTP